MTALESVRFRSRPSFTEIGDKLTSDKCILDFKAIRDVLVVCSTPLDM